MPPRPRSPECAVDDSGAPRDSSLRTECYTTLNMSLQHRRSQFLVERQSSGTRLWWFEPRSLGAGVDCNSAPDMGDSSAQHTYGATSCLRLYRSAVTPKPSCAYIVPSSTSPHRAPVVKSRRNHTHNGKDCIDNWHHGTRRVLSRRAPLEQGVRGAWTD